ncbi:SDR family NAD(P)-dependent oxidoreductase [Acidimangrovimonas pyrenivorans]|uniref:SDR family NAD(P)-dependent oxidoreductase n=1 Tax=Acidimangrovimonas pyrenivorans TaxID=2030798 RepID=A0ABV7ANZ1_9RHOB
MAQPLALIVGVGTGLSAALARRFAEAGYRPVLAARDAGKLAPLAAETGAATARCDAADPASVAALFAGLEAPPRVVVYNPSARVRGPIAEVDPAEVRKALDVTAFGAFLTGQAAARAMLAAAPQDGIRGTILFTGASAGVKGYPQSASFAMGKFASRGLAQSMARELHPQGIHVAWINIDGMIRNPGRVEPTEAPDSMLDPDAIAQTYLALVEQPRSAWSEEISVRPWVEKF